MRGPFRVLSGVWGSSRKQLIINSFKVAWVGLLVLDLKTGTTRGEFW